MALILVCLLLVLVSYWYYITYISSPIEYQDLAQLEFTAHNALMLRASEAALDPKHSLRPA
jgi:hypothetical protein